MVYIYFFYALAFILLAGNLGLQTRSPIRLMPLPAIWMLFLFTLFHAICESVQLLHYIETIGAPEMTPFAVDLVGALSMPISFLFLLAFGFELLVCSKVWPKWTRSVYLAIWLVCLFLSAAEVLPAFFQISEWSPHVERISRLAIGFPAAILAAISFRLFERSQNGKLTGRTRALLYGSSIAMFVYGVASGLAYLPTVILTHSNSAVQQPAVDIALALLLSRAFAAAALGVLLTEALVVEVAKVQVASMQSRQEFVSAVGHDLRSAISAIDMSAQILHRLIPQGRQLERQLEITESIRSSVRLLIKMISDFFDLSLIDISRIELKKRPTNVIGLVSRAAKQTELISGRKIQFEAPGAELSANIDEERVEQVLDNLLSNAAKYSSPDTNIVCGLTPEKQGIKITVESQGPQIPPEKVAHLFDRFYRATKSAGGTGLGLHIVKGLVDAHGGKVGVKSSEAGTTVFDVWLPA